MQSVRRSITRVYIQHYCDVHSLSLCTLVRLVCMKCTVEIDIIYSDGLYEMANTDPKLKYPLPQEILIGQV